MSKPKERKARSGPAPERLKIEGDWKLAIKSTLQKKKPKRGWPKSK